MQKNGSQYCAFVKMLFRGRDDEDEDDDDEDNDDDDVDDDDDDNDKYIIFNILNTCLKNLLKFKLIHPHNL